MSNSFVLPIIAAITPTIAGEPLPEGESEPASDFSIEDLSEEISDDATLVDLPVATTAPQDRLQMLIEDLSGISGALRESPAGDAAQPDLPDGKSWAQEQGVRIAPAPLPVETQPAPLPQQEPSGPDIDPLLADALMADPLLADTPLPPTHAARDIAAAGPDQPVARAPVASIARQIAEAVVTTRDDRIEVALAPEELGRIRLVMSGPEHSPHVLVWAERPEVLDQLRRNATILQDCFGDAGMADASFEFQGDSQSGSGQRDSSPDAFRQGFDMVETVSISLPAAWTPMAVSARLDIRI